MTEPFLSHPRSSAANGGDREDQQEYVRLLIEHERRLEGYVLALVSDWTAAEDIIQETKLKLWEQFDRFDRNHDFGAWARTIAYYQVLTYRKSQRRSRERLFSEDFLRCVAQEESRLQEEIAVRQSFLASCLAKLSEKARNLLQLVYSGEDTIRHIAHKLGRSEAATYSAVQDARLRLHNCLEKELRRESHR